MNITTKTLKTLTYTTGFLAMLSVGFFGASAVLADTTYYYVTADDQLAMVEADTPTEAINSATDIKYNSGVITAEELFGQGGDSATAEADSETYLYVDEDGNIEAEAAVSASAALVESDDDAQYNSGVIEADEFYELAGETTVTTDADMNTYAYVTMSDAIAYESAMSWEAAIMQADNIKYNSGVMLVTE